MKKLISLLLLVILANPLDVFAQEAPGNFERISIEQGLSQVTVYCILQDSQGFLWFGTEDGLNRYDGYTFKVYKRDPDDVNSLSANTIRSLYEDSSGALWIGTDGGLNKFDRKAQRFSHYRNDPNAPNSLSHNTVTDILEDSLGKFWIGTEGGLNAFDPITGEFTAYRHLPDDPLSLSHDHVSSILEDSSGNLWVGTSGGGLNLLNRSNGKFTHFRHNHADSNSLINDEVTTILEAQPGKLWIGTEGGLEEFYYREQRFIHYHSDFNAPHTLSSNEITQVVEDSSGGIWVGTRFGLNEFDRQTRQFTRFLNDPRDPSSLSSIAVISILEDASGVLWVGTVLGGINKLDRKTRRFTHFKNDVDDSNSLGSNAVWAIYEDDTGALWIGTSGTGGGLDRLDRASGLFTHFSPDPEDPFSLSAYAVTAIYQDSDGAIWLGTYDGGINKIESQDVRRPTGHFVHYRHDPKDPMSLSSNTIWSIQEDSSGTLWFGTIDAGLEKFDRGTGQFTHYRHDPNAPGSLSSDFVLAIYEDRLGKLWVGTTQGLNEFDRQTETFRRYQNTPTDPQSLTSDAVAVIFEDSSGTLWLGTDDGLDKFDRATSKFIHYSEKDGLVNDAIAGILEDEEGYLWVSSGRGLSKVDPHTMEFKNFDVRDGLQSNEFNRGAYYKSKRGEMFFGGINGFNAFNPADIKDNPHAPPIVLTGFYIFNKPVGIGGDSPLQESIEETEKITLSYWDYIFSFEFAALDFSIPSKNQFAYKMEGLEEEWNYVDSNRRFASYANLPAGKYSFRVIGSNNDGVWNTTGVTLPITITPPPWMTWWAYTLYALILLLAVAAYVRYRLHELESIKEIRASRLSLAQAQHQLLRSREEERGRLARDLHDGPLQTLVGLNIQLGLFLNSIRKRKKTDSPAVETVEVMQTEVRDLLTNLRSVCTELRPPMLDTIGLGAALTALAQDWSELNNVSIRLDLPPDETSRRLSGEVALNLYRIVQEALSNVTRHAQARQVDLHLTWENHQLELNIHDDGQGFQLPNTLHNLTAQGHFGLVGMRERAGLIGGEFSLQSAPGQGTTVRVTWRDPSSESK